MLYQAAVILTYPVMLERALTPCALRGLARRRPCWSRRYQAWGGDGDTQTHRRGGDTAETTAAAQPDTSFPRWHLNLSGSIHQREGREELRGMVTKASSISEGLSIRGCVRRRTGSSSTPTCLT